jgi:hypothetical protein
MIFTASIKQLSIFLSIACFNVEGIFVMCKHLSYVGSMV